ncbi:MAG: ABC transporter permease subunit [Pararhizobium sp.]|nr:ABC transporter permease subunit [Pararhizobium sp.]MDO9416866.1 ABC transporter permease subunit [Pararhizobium sp.]
MIIASRILPGLFLFVLAAPVVAGFAGTLLPAFGYLPAIGGHALTLNHFRQLAAEPGLLQSSLLSLTTGLLATGITFIMVLLFTAAFAGTTVFSRIQHLVSPLLAIPHAAAAFGIAFLIAPSGMILRLISPELTGFTRPPDWLVVNDPMGLSMVLGLVAKEVPFLFLMVLAALPQLPVRQARQTMASLGFGRISGFLVALAPGLYRQIRLPVFVVLAYSTSVVDVAVILGPGLPAPLSVRLTAWMADPDLQARFLASAGALLQLGITGLAMVLWWGLERLAGAALRALSLSGWRLTGDRPVRIAALAGVMLSALSIFGGIAILALWSIAGLWAFPQVLPDEISLKTWAKVLPQIFGPLTTTVLAGVVAAAIATVLAIGLLWSETRNGASASKTRMPILYLPLIVPQLAFVFGLQVLVLSLGLEPSFLILVAVHLVFVLPYVVLSLSDPWRALDRRYELVAHSLGKSATAVLFQIRLPMLLRACLTAFAIGFAVSAGLYLPTLLIGAGRLVTLATETVALSSGGDRRVIGVYALLQILLPFVAFVIASLIPHLLFRNRRAMRI